MILVYFGIALLLFGIFYISASFLGLVPFVQDFKQKSLETVQASYRHSFLNKHEFFSKKKHIPHSQ